MYKFIKTKDENNEFDKINVLITIPYNDITLDDLFEAFTYFVKACGFYINDKMVGLIQDENTIINEEEER